MTSAFEGAAEPPLDCPACPRLVSFRADCRRRDPAGYNAPVLSFGPTSARLLVVGLAPGRDGANRTGRPFTGDWAGDLLYETLKLYGFASGTYDERPDDGLTLEDCLVTNAVRCVPPANKPTPVEIATCRTYLSERIAAAADLKIVLALGRIAHESVVRALGFRLAECRSDMVADTRSGRSTPPHPFRQLPLLPLQHEHRRPDDGHVPRGLRRYPQPHRRRRSARRYM